MKVLDTKVTRNLDLIDRRTMKNYLRMFDLDSRKVEFFKNGNHCIKD